jgi:site-specific DNA recombinase
MSNRAAIYTRISQLDPDVEKTDLQEQRLRKLAKAEGYVISYVFEDNGISAWSGKARPAFLRMLDDIRLDKFDVILAVAEDRLARNSQEKIGLQAECSKNGVTWHTLAGGKIDPGTASGGMLSTITGAIAEYESTIKAERVRARIESEAYSGRGSWGTRVFGFEKDRVTHVPEEAAAIRSAYRAILEGGTLYGTTKALNDKGLTTSRGGDWSYQSARKLLLNPRNAGLVVHRGEVLEGVESAWEAIVSLEDFEAVRAILTDAKRKTAPGRKPVHLLAGVAKCDCGSTMRSATATLSGVPALVYRCKASAVPTATRRRHTSMTLEVLDKMAMRELVGALMFGPADSVPEREGADVAELHKNLSRIRSAQQRFFDLVEEGVIEMTDVAANLKRLKDEETEAQARIDQESVDSASASLFASARASLLRPGRIDMKNAVAARQTITERFKALDFEKQKELVKAHLDITVGAGRKDDRVTIIHKIVTSLN